MRRVWLVWWAWVALASGGAACGEGGEPLAEYFTVSGTLTSISHDASGRNAYLRLVSGTPETTMSESGTRFAGARAEFLMRLVPAGSYTLHAFVDMDGNASSADPVASSGDLVSPGRSLSVYSNVRADIADDAWSLMP
ncbi:MAG: hypothetical protein GYA21_15890 [Myxococcales bacterium]|nr:hypothetical protein [Myxococcales bacterium]